MPYAQDYLMVTSLAALVAAAILGGATGVAANVLHRSTQRAKDVATLRILGARRPHIFRMFLAENVAGVVLGIVLASLVLAGVFALWRPQYLVAVLLGAVLVIGSATIGYWLAVRHASRTPFAKSGLFRAAPDKRGE